jgi:hypothetical protein
MAEPGRGPEKGEKMVKLEGKRVKKIFFVVVGRVAGVLALILFIDFWVKWLIAG